jgi:hypothetical protein
MGESDLRAYIRERMDESDRKLDAWEARMGRLPPLPDDYFAEDRRRRALLIERARRLGRKRHD